MIFNRLRPASLLLSACILAGCMFAHTTYAQTPPAAAAGILSADETAKTLPATVFFKGQTAPVQLRNAGAVRFMDGSILFAALVDTGGYATSVQNKYQFYMVTETGIRIADKALPPGAYGCGFLADGSMVVMDVGAHDLLTVPTATDAALRRPRPLDILKAQDGYRLYLGRRYVTFTASADRR